MSSVTGSARPVDPLRDALVAEIEDSSTDVLGEVLDFVRFVKRSRAGLKPDNYLASEAVLARDWLGGYDSRYPRYAISSHGWR